MCVWGGTYAFFTTLPDLRFSSFSSLARKSDSVPLADKKELQAKTIHVRIVANHSTLRIHIAKLRPHEEPNTAQGTDGGHSRE